MPTRVHYGIRGSKADPFLSAQSRLQSYQLNRDCKEYVRQSKVETKEKTPLNWRHGASDLPFFFYNHGGGGEGPHLNEFIKMGRQQAYLRLQSCLQ
jgi:hypothetical protein